MRTLALLALVSFPVPALAGQIALWSQEEWSSGDDVAGTDGWVNGYPADKWFGSQSGNSLISGTDDNIGDSEGDFYGSGWAADNWLIRGPSFADGGVKVTVGNLEEDAVGLVLSHNGSNSFYLLVHTSDSAPPPVGAVEDTTMLLIRVQDGVGTEVARREVSGFPRDAVLMRLNRDNNRLNAYFGTTFVFGWDDPNPLPAGQAGVYSYDCGTSGGFDQTFSYFGDVYAYQFDIDDDTIADDVDNCPDVANQDQTDTDDDGTGDACDDTPGGGGGTDDTDGGGGSDTDTDPSTDGGTTDGPTTDDPSTDDGSDDGATDGGIRVADCEGCSSSGSTGGALAAALGALALVRRRR